MNSDAAGDQHDGQTRKQPPADRIATIGITATADDVEGRPVRHKLNVSAQLRPERAARALRAAEVRREDTGSLSDGETGPSRQRPGTSRICKRKDSAMAELERREGNFPDRAPGSRNGQIAQLIEAAYGATPQQRGEGATLAWGHPAVVRLSGHLAAMQRTVYPVARRRLGEDLNLLWECRAHARETRWALRLVHCHLAGDGAAGGRKAENVHGWLEHCLAGYRPAECSTASTHGPAQLALIEPPAPEVPGRWPCHPMAGTIER
jgi:hypothetical protein